MSHRLPLAILLSCSATVSAQTVWSMGAPWLDLDQVIAQAAPRDVVLLNGMTFAPITLGKGLTILGPGTIRPTTLTAVDSASRLTIPTGQMAHIVDVLFAPHAVLPMFTHRVEASGTVAFEGCSFLAGASANLVARGTVLLHQCSVSGSAVNGGLTAVGGLRVEGGVCSIVDCSVTGASAVFSNAYSSYIVPPSPALSVFAGHVVVSHSVLIGGSGGAHAIFGNPQPGAPAVVVPSQFASLSLSDCSLRGGGSPGSLPGPVALAGNPNTAHARTGFLGGPGATTGAATSGGVLHVPQLVGLTIDQGLRLGSATTVSAMPGSTQVLGLFVSFDPNPTTQPGVIGPIFGTVGQLVPVLLAAPIIGLAVDHTIIVPNHFGLLGVTIFVQAGQIDGSVVRVSAGAGGVVH